MKAHRSAFSVNLDSENTASLFHLASDLLTRVGYKDGRVRRELAFKLGNGEKQGIRAPGPAVGKKTESVGKVEEVWECAALDREAASFHTARRRFDPRKARVCSTRAGPRQGAVSARHQRFLSLREDYPPKVVSQADKQLLHSLFRNLKRQEDAKAERAVQQRIGARQRYRLFDAEAYRTRIETSKEAEMGQRVRARVTPVLSKARSRLRSAHSERIPPAPTADLQSYLSSVLVGNTYSGPRTASEDQDHSLFITRLQWLANEGLQRFIPHLQLKEVSL